MDNIILCAICGLTEKEHTLANQQIDQYPDDYDNIIMQFGIPCSNFQPTKRRITEEFKQIEE